MEEQGAVNAAEPTAVSLPPLDAKDENARRVSASQELSEWKGFALAQQQALRRAQINKVLFPNRKRADDFDPRQFPSLATLKSAPLVAKTHGSRSAGKRHGADQLGRPSNIPIKELDAVPSGQVKYRDAFLHQLRASVQAAPESDAPAKTAAVSRAVTARAAGPVNEFKQMLQQVVHRVRDSSWLAQTGHAGAFVDAIYLELASWFSRVEAFTSPQLSPQQNQTLATETFRAIDAAVDRAVERARVRKAHMDEQNHFPSQVNWERVLAAFRTDVHRWIAGDAFHRRLVDQVKHGRSPGPSVALLMSPEHLRRQLYAMKQELSVIADAPRPVLAPPAISSRASAAATMAQLRQALLRSHRETAGSVGDFSAGASVKAGLDSAGAQGSTTARWNFAASVGEDDVGEATTSATLDAQLNDDFMAALHQQQVGSSGGSGSEQAFQSMHPLLHAHSELGGGTRSPRRRWAYPASLSGSSVAQEASESGKASPAPALSTTTAAPAVAEAPPQDRYLQPRGEKADAIARLADPPTPHVDSAIPQAPETLQRNPPTPGPALSLMSHFTATLPTTPQSDQYYQAVMQVPCAKITPREVHQLVSLDGQQPMAMFEILVTDDGAELDERLARQREIEELFDEIVHGVDSNVWDQSETVWAELGAPSAASQAAEAAPAFAGMHDPTAVAPCPVAPADNHPSLAFRGLLVAEEMMHTVFDDPDEAPSGRRARSAGRSAGGTGSDSAGHGSGGAADSSAAGATGPANVRERGEAHRRTQVRMLTRSESTGAIDATLFSLNRRAAMQLTQSSRYPSFRYNYGGYIPKTVGRVRRARKGETAKGAAARRLLMRRAQGVGGGLLDSTRLTANEYKKYLKVCATDLIRDLIDAEQTEEEKRKLAKLAAEEELRKLRQAELRRMLDARRSRLAEKRSLTRFVRQSWNPGTLRYIEEMHDQFVHEQGLAAAAAATGGARVVGQSFADAAPSDENDRILSMFNHYNDSAMVSRRDRSATTGAAESVGADSMGGSPRPLTAQDKRVFVSEAALPVVAVQEDMERVWDLLETPHDQRVAMAVRWSKPSYWAARSRFRSLMSQSAPAAAAAAAMLHTGAGANALPVGETQTEKVQEALRLYKGAADAIRERETVVRQLSEFERFASNPERYFARGFQGSSSARLIEAVERSDISQRLRVADERVRLCIKRIKRKLHEAVTFRGQPYLEKMRRDIPQIFHELHQGRLAAQRPRTGGDASAPDDDQFEDIIEEDESDDERHASAQQPPPSNAPRAATPGAGGILEYLARRQQLGSRGAPRGAAPPLTSGLSASSSASLVRDPATQSTHSLPRSRNASFRADSAGGFSAGRS